MKRLIKRLKYLFYLYLRNDMKNHLDASVPTTRNGKSSDPDRER